MKIVFVLIDGLGDNVPDSPLSEAKIPHLSYLTKEGISGLMDPFSPGIACGSDCAHLSIFGYPPETFYRGRGAFEALGSGMDLIQGDIAFKSNFAWKSEEGIIDRRRADRNFHKWGFPRAIDAIHGLSVKNHPEIAVSVKHATEHRCVVGLRKLNESPPFLSDKISGTDPLKDDLPILTSHPIASAVNDPDACYTAQVVNSLSESISTVLENLEFLKERERSGLKSANCVLLRGCGGVYDVPSFQERYGLNGFMIAPTAIIAGIGKTIGLDVFKAPGATGDCDSDYTAKATCFLENITCYDFGFLHVKSVDEASHDRDRALKIRMLEKVDAMLGLLIDGFIDSTEKVVFVVTGDHTTSLVTGDHSCEPVPFVMTLLNAKNSPRDGNEVFEETHCANGGLGRFRGSEVMKMLLKVKRMYE